MKKFRFNASQRGFTLIELMIAMLIGVFLMTGVIQIFLSAKQAYRLQENLSRLQENGRFAMDMITKDIRMAGYVAYACLPVTILPSAFAAADTTWCSNSTGNKNCIASTTVTTGNTVNTIRTDVIRSYQWSNLVVASPPTAASCPPTAPPAVLTNQSEISYFIRGDDSNSKMPALFRFDSGSASLQERAESIERMQILYGIDTDATPDYVPNYYANADTVNTAAVWNKIVSIRVTLLVVTPDNGLTDAPQPYVFNGITYGTTANPIPKICSSNGVVVDTALAGSSTAPTCTSPDKLIDDLRIRRVFSSTIAVRNRLL